MMRKIINITKSYSTTVGLYFMASLIPMVLNMVINPLIAINMSPDDYAVVGYYTSFNTLISPIVLFYMLHYYNKCYFELDEANRLKLKATIFKSLIFFSAFISLICVCGIIGYTKLFNADSTIPLFPYVALSVLALPFTGVLSLAQADYRMGRKPKQFFYLTVSSGVLQVILTLMLVVVWKLGAVGKLSAILIGNIVFFIVCCVIYKNLFSISFEWTTFKKILGFCWPLAIAAMLGFFFNGYDKIFLERLGDNTELGYYTVGVSIAGYISVFQAAISSTFQPDIYESIVKRNKIKLLKVTCLMIGGTAAIVITFVVLAPFIIEILTAGRYMQSVRFAQVVAFSTLTNAIYFTASQIIIALGYTKLTLLNKSISSVLVIVMFSILISKYQFNGAAIGLVLANLVSAVGILVLILIKRRYVVKNS